MDIERDASARPALDLSPRLEPERETYRRAIASALRRVGDWFAGHDLPCDPSDLIDRAVVHADVAEARPALARVFGIDEAGIPEAISGTVRGRTLFLVSRACYESTHRRLYPEHPWTPGCHDDLVVHELAHRAHEVVAIALTGTSDGMGPRWFFEGLAIACAGQFDTPGVPALSRSEIADVMARDAVRVLGYPLYGRLFRTLAALHPVRWMVEEAAMRARAGSNPDDAVFWSDGSRSSRTASAERPLPSRR